jgi:hypothetical protein
MADVLQAMARSKLGWCIVRLGDDFNWWVHEVSDDIHWEADGLGLLDPNQVEHMVDLFVQMQTYGLRYDIVENAFIKFSVEKEMPKSMVRLVATEEELMAAKDKIFAMPNAMDDGDGPYSDFIDHIMAVRVRMLNANLNFKQPLSVDELEENIRDEQQKEYVGGKGVHAFNEIVAILDYVPVGYDLDGDSGERGLVDDDDLSVLDGGVAEDLSAADIGAGHGF